jgi:sugar transferase (PEP-CTERM/EpsH1 system associated)
MNILYLAHRIPYPPNKGDKIRSYHQIRHLARNHNVYIACFVDDPDDFQHADHLKEICKDVRVVPLRRWVGQARSIWSLISGKSISVGYYGSSGMRSAISSLLEQVKIDLAFIFSSTMAQFIFNRKGLKKVMDFVDVDSEKWRQYAELARFPMSAIYRMEAGRLKFYEMNVARRVDCSFFVTEAERDLFATFSEGCRLEVVHNGVDSNYFRRSEATALNGTPPYGVFVGAMDYFPNIDAVGYFANEILPKIWEELPEFEFEIVGRNPPDDVTRLAAKDRRIRVHGTVPDVRPYLERATVSVAPLRIARGVQNKVLEAMAMGVPVVATRDAFEGIRATPDRDLIVVDDPAEMASAVVRIARDSALRIDLSQSGRALVEKEYGWGGQMEYLEAILAGV